MSKENKNVDPLPPFSNADSAGAHETKDGASKFDVSKLRLSQDFASNVGVKKALLTVPVRKPDRQSFVRVHPDPQYRLQTAVLELKEDRETYLVDPDLWNEMPGDVIPMELFTAITRQGVLFLWPVRLPGEDGRQLEWHRSAFEAAEMAMGKWVKVQVDAARRKRQVMHVRTHRELPAGIVMVFSALEHCPGPVQRNDSGLPMLGLQFPRGRTGAAAKVQDDARL